MRRTKSLAVLAATATVAGAWTPALGSSLTSIGVLEPSIPYSEIRAVSQDGSYVVGTSTAASGINVPIIWSASDGLVALPNPSGANSIGIGVSVGIGSNDGNIIIAGLHEGDNKTQRYYKAPLTDLASGSWADCALAGGFPNVSDMRGGAYNDLRSDPNVADGRWYTAGKLNSSGRDGRLRGDPFIGWDGTGVRNVTSESAYGINVGRGNESPSAAFYEGPQLAYGTVPGSSGYRADGIGISPSFGKNGSGDYDVQWISGQVFNYNGADAQGFRWKLGDASMTFLGTLPGDTSSCAYTIADNGVTAGRSYLSATSVETAVVWDTSGTWDTTGTAQSIQALLTAVGVNTSAWTSLVRVYAASEDGKVLAGFGIWAEDGSTRGFVAEITPTAPVAVQITDITLSGGTVTIDFTSSNTSDTTAAFIVQEAATLVDAGTSFADVTPAATITGSAGSFQATFAPSGDQHFYQIKRP